MQIGFSVNYDSRFVRYEDVIRNLKRLNGYQCIKNNCFFIFSRYSQKYIFYILKYSQNIIKFLVK